MVFQSTLVQSSTTSVEWRPRWSSPGAPHWFTAGQLWLEMVCCMSTSVLWLLEDRHKRPTISSCSAGVGRTGTLIAIDIALEQAARQSVVDIPAIVTKMRRQRMKMVQTSVREADTYLLWVHYKPHIYDQLLSSEYAIIISISLRISENYTHFVMLHWCCWLTPYDDARSLHVGLHWFQNQLVVW